MSEISQRSEVNTHRLSHAYLSCIISIILAPNKERLHKFLGIFITLDLI